MQTMSSTGPLCVDSEVERTTRRNNSLTRKTKTLEMLARQEPNSPISPNLPLPSIQEEEHTMVEEEPGHQPPR